jgi:hypothetical protein
LPAPKDSEKYFLWIEKLKGNRNGSGNKGKTSPLRGRKHSEVTKEKISKSCSIVATEKCFGKWMKGRVTSGTLENLRQINLARKGKTYEEIYGGQAEAEKAKRSVSNRARWLGVPRKYRPKQEGNLQYIQWRKAVFERDDYTC